MVIELNNMTRNEIDLNHDKVKIVKETAEAVGVDPGPSTMLAFIGASPEMITRVMGAQINTKITKEAEEKHPTPDGLPSDYNEIERIIHGMMIENTGAHFLDSGGAYGRNWERNRAVPDFRKDQALTVDIDEAKHKPGHYYVEYSVDVFTYLTETLDTDETTEKLERLFSDYMKQNPDLGWYSGVREFIEADIPDLCIENTGGENTYNRDSILSQVLQYELFEIDGTTYTALQIHNGCDVRGGYTRPRFFVLGDWDEYLPSDCNINAQCGCVSIWSDICGYHWYENTDDRPDPAQTDLEGEYIYNPPVLETDRELPKFWAKVDRDPEHGEYVGDKMLVCAYCDQVVKFWGCV